MKLAQAPSRYCHWMSIGSSRSLREHDARRQSASVVRTLEAWSATTLAPRFGCCPPAGMVRCASSTSISARCRPRHRARGGRVPVALMRPGERAARLGLGERGRAGRCSRLDLEDPRYLPAGRSCRAMILAPSSTWTATADSRTQGVGLRSAPGSSSSTAAPAPGPLTSYVRSRPRPPRRDCRLISLGGPVRGYLQAEPALVQQIRGAVQLVLHAEQPSDLRGDPRPPRSSFQPYAAGPASGAAQPSQLPLIEPAYRLARAPGRQRGQGRRTASASATDAPDLAQPATAGPSASGQCPARTSARPEAVASHTRPVVPERTARHHRDTSYLRRRSATATDHAGAPNVIWQTQTLAIQFL